MSLSLVIPTVGRGERLARTLRAIAERQDESPALEVIVVEDGAREPRPDSPFANPGMLRFEPLESPRRGPAAARNCGIRVATGERILLLGDDTAPAPGCLARHATATHGLQGRIDWDPDRPVTPLMRFLAPAGPQFWFVGLTDGEEIPWSAVLGSNYSAPRAWFLAEPFDESFPDAAFEDSELAWRFRERGFKSFYAECAVAWHDHAYDEIGPFLERQRRAGRAARAAVARHPGLLTAAFLKPLAVHLLKLVLPGARPEPERSWDASCRRSYLAGFFAGAKSASPT